MSNIKTIYSPVDSFWNLYNSLSIQKLVKGRTIKGFKYCNIHDPFEFTFKKKFGYLPKNSIWCNNGNVYIIIE